MLEEEYKKLSVEQIVEMMHYNAQKIRRFHNLNKGVLKKNNMYVRLKTSLPLRGFGVTGRYLEGEDFIFRDLFIEADWTEEYLLTTIKEAIKPANLNYYYKDDGTEYSKIVHSWKSIQSRRKYRFAVLPCRHQRLYFMDAFKIYLTLKEITLVKRVKTGVFQEVDYCFQKLNKTKIMEELML